MVYFKVGTNFDPAIIDIANELNCEYGNRATISEFYGSIRDDAGLAARPPFRLPKASRKELEKFVDDANAIGVKVNYTFNSIVPYGSKANMLRHEVEIMQTIHELEEMGVSLLTVSSPMLLELIKHNGGTSLDLEISTIAHVDTLTQIKYYHDVYGVKKICGNLLKNRDFEFTEKAAQLCSRLGMQYELMANEFCGVGTEGYATHCIYRDSCYVCHATNNEYYETGLLDNYPMNMCTHGRNANPANWLRSNFIRPEDIYAYVVETGCNRFKLTGRTGSIDFQRHIMEVYMRGSFHGDLLELWKPLETIKEHNESDTVDYKIIPNDCLRGFIDHWRTGFKCAEEVCGTTCDYCQRWYNENVNRND